jgi:outer membrane protein assembly factor BamE (lipoprotein component of BamABCDE complex)
MQRISGSAFLALVVTALGMGACAPVQDQHGFVSDGQVTLSDVQVGVDTMDTVRGRLGSPSTVGTFDQTAWYYVSSTTARLAFLTPETVERSVLVVRFDDNQVVTAVENFGMERGQVVSFASAETPTRGRELGLLEQLFGTIGAGPPVGLTEEDEGRPSRR